MNLAAQIEALLFVAGEPVKIRRLATLTSVAEDQIRSALQELGQRYETTRGLRLLVKDDQAETVTHPDHAALVAAYLKSTVDEDLSDAASETLAIIAYRGPITRSALEDIRGVNSTYTLRALLLRGLAERVTHPQDPRTFLYRISFDFLEYLGLRSREDLPEFDALSKLTLAPAPERSLQDAGAAPTP